MSDQNRNLGVSDEVIREGLHLCYLYSDDEERTKVMAGFLLQGLRDGEKVLCIRDTESPHPIENELEGLGTPTTGTGVAFETAENEASYCPGGAFEPDALLEGVGDFCRQATAEGFRGARISGDMSWSVRKGTSTESLLDYEVKVTDFLRSCPFVAICEYDVRKFDGATLMELLRVHPAVIVGGQVMYNPYYVPPKEALEGKLAT